MTSLTQIFAPFKGETLLEWLTDLTALWHETGPIVPKDYLSPIGMSQWIHYHNYALWHLEDEARRTDVPDSEIAKCKRAIDKHNQKRNDGIEQVDIWIENVLKTAGIETDANVEINSETPGSIIDRLSILSLKIFHMSEQCERKGLDEDIREMLQVRTNILLEQRDDLSKSLNKLILDLRQAKKRHKVYRQFKMYNDPQFNPSIYKNK